MFVFRKWTYKIIIDVLLEAQLRYGVKIHHFKMMHTHYHMLITTTLSNLSEFLWFVNNQIAKRLNRRMKRKGHLWSSRFKSTIVQADRHLAACTRYIYRNGVRAGYCERASEDDQFSTFEFYAKGKLVPFVVTEDDFYLMEGDTVEARRAGFIEFVDGQPMSKDDIEALRRGLRRLFYGSADFIGEMRSRYLR